MKKTITAFGRKLQVTYKEVGNGATIEEVRELKLFGSKVLPVEMWRFTTLGQEIVKEVTK